MRPIFLILLLGLNALPVATAAQEPPCNPSIQDCE